MTSDELPGGRYQLIRQIGKGGMGSVWLAEDKLLRRRVALKQIRSEDGGDLTELRQRALGEARAMMMVNHPAIVQFHDVFLVGRDPWIDMEYIEGDSFEAIIQQRSPDRPLSERAIAEIALPILRGLGVTHAAGVVHRDVKPGNILVTRDKSVFLVDFGIARIDGDTPLTRLGRMIGTPEYMAPERIQGLTVGPKSDLWSLGVTLFYALEGYSPFFRGGEAAYHATMYEILSKPTPRPKRQGKLADIVLRLLEKSPRHRATAAELEQVLQGIVDGRRPPPLPASGPTTRKLSATAPWVPDFTPPPMRSAPAPRQRPGEAALTEIQLADARDAIRKTGLDTGMGMLLSMSEGNAAKVLAGLGHRETGALIQAIATSKPQTAAAIIKILSSSAAGGALDFVATPAAVSILNTLPVHDAARIINRADPKTAAQILMKLQTGVSVELLQAMQIRPAATALGRIWPDKVANYFRDSEDLSRRLLNELDPGFRNQVLRHLR